VPTTRILALEALMSSLRDMARLDQSEGQLLSLEAFFRLAPD
jgi:hypothetical protein